MLQHANWFKIIALFQFCVDSLYLSLVHKAKSINNCSSLYGVEDLKLIQHWDELQHWLWARPHQPASVLRSCGSMRRSLQLLQQRINAYGVWIPWLTVTYGWNVPVAAYFGPCSLYKNADFHSHRGETNGCLEVRKKQTLSNMKNTTARHLYSMYWLMYVGCI